MNNVLELHVALYFENKWTYMTGANENSVTILVSNALSFIPTTSDTTRVNFPSGVDYNPRSAWCGISVWANRLLTAITGAFAYPILWTPKGSRSPPGTSCHRRSGVIHGMHVY